MSQTAKKLNKGEILFREGDTPDAMYVIKSGMIAITKTKGSGSIVLAEKKAGEMLGEMAFFDAKPRSAHAVAATEAEVIALPFTALQAQFNGFPEWIKAIVKTVTAQLRDANTKIKTLEQVQNENEEFFTPYLITRLAAIISLIGYKAGEKTPEGHLVIPFNTLRNYCIQIFQQPTNKLDKLMEVLSALQIMKVEELGEGKKKITILKHQMLTEFVDWYNKWLFTEEKKRVEILEKEMPAARALLFYGSKQTPDAKGEVTVNLTEMQNNSMKDLNNLFNVNDADTLAEKGLAQEKQSAAGGQLTMKFKYQELATQIPYWEMIYTLKKVQRR